MIMMAVGIVLLFGTVGVAMNTVFNHSLKKAAVSTHSATVNSSGSAASCQTASVLGNITGTWLTSSREASQGFVSVIVAKGGSYSALWLMGVAAASLCMFYTRP